MLRPFSIILSYHTYSNIYWISLSLHIPSLNFKHLIQAIKYVRTFLPVNRIAYFKSIQNRFKTDLHHMCLLKFIHETLL